MAILSNQARSNLRKVGTRQAFQTTIPALAGQVANVFGSIQQRRMEADRFAAQQRAAEEAQRFEREKFNTTTGLKRDELGLKEKGLDIQATGITARDELEKAKMAADEKFRTDQLNQQKMLAEENRKAALQRAKVSAGPSYRQDQTRREANAYRALLEQHREAITMGDPGAAEAIQQKIMAHQAAGKATAPLSAGTRARQGYDQQGVEAAREIAKVKDLLRTNPSAFMNSTVASHFLESFVVLKSADGRQVSLEEAREAALRAGFDAQAIEQALSGSR